MDNNQVYVGLNGRDRSYPKSPVSRSRLRWCLYVASDASNHNFYAGVEGFTSQEDQEMISRIEKQLKRRFAIGSQVSEHSIVQDFTKQVSVSEMVNVLMKRAIIIFFFFVPEMIFIVPVHLSENGGGGGVKREQRYRFSIM